MYKWIEETLARMDQKDNYFWEVWRIVILIKNGWFYFPVFCNTQVSLVEKNITEHWNWSLEYTEGTRPWWTWVSKAPCSLTCYGISSNTRCWWYTVDSDKERWVRWTQQGGQLQTSFAGWAIFLLSLTRMLWFCRIIIYLSLWTSYKIYFNCFIEW